MGNPVSAQTIEKALPYISADCDRDTWVKVGMAIKSELGDSGFHLFDDWSKQTKNYNTASIRDTWKSIKAGGGISIGTLLHLAKQGGWKPERPNLAPTAKELAKRKADAEKRKARAAEEEQRKSKRQTSVKGQAQKWWKAAQSVSHAHPYLNRKQIKAHGLKLEGDALLVPLRVLETGEIQNLQTIFPHKRKIRNSTEPRDKDYMPGGRKRGLCHKLGSPENGKPFAITEGYATAASIYESTGFPVLVAFDVGNIKHISRTARQHYPDSHIVIAADNDRWTKNNPGIRAAKEAAKMINSVVAIPEFPESTNSTTTLGQKGLTDFNDLHIAMGADEVSRVINLALAKLTLNIPNGFRLTKDGLFFEDPDKHGREWICSPLKVSAVTRNDNNREWGRLLEFTDMDGNLHKWAMPAQMLSGDGNEYRRTLLDSGVRIGSGNRAKNLLTQYIQTCAPFERARCVSKTGWFDNAYVLPDEVIGKQEGERIILQTCSDDLSGYDQKGSLQEWRDNLSRYCVGNSRLILAVCSAFAPVLLEIHNTESGGFHFRGNSSIGKSTALYVAASVWGGADRVRRWRTTDNGLEGLAQIHNDSLLCLDELKELDPKDAGKIVYMLANGQGKQRAGRNGEQRNPATWRLLFISTGELSIADHIRDGGGRVFAGQEVRIADLPAEPEGGHGIFETLHDFASGVYFSGHLMKASRGYHGTPSREFIRQVSQQCETVMQAIQDIRQRFSSEFVPDAADGQVCRVADRFALVAAAGELATMWGITGWQPGEATTGVYKCFYDWLEYRGGSGKKETANVIRQVREFLQLHGDARFVPLNQKAQGGYKFGNRAGYRDSNLTNSTFYIFTEVYSREVCKGFDIKFASKTLSEAGFLEHDKGRFNKKLPKDAPDGTGRPRVYAIKGVILEDE